MDKEEVTSFSVTAREQKKEEKKRQKISIFNKKISLYFDSSPACLASLSLSLVSSTVMVIFLNE